LSSGIQIKSTLPYSRQHLSGCRTVITRFHQQDSRANSLDRMCRTVDAGSWSSPAHLRNQTDMAFNLEGGRWSFQWDEMMHVALVSTIAQCTICVRLGGGWSVSASACCTDLVVGRGLIARLKEISKERQQSLTAHVPLILALKSI
jgi:hypothetical protein